MGRKLSREGNYLQPEMADHVEIERYVRTQTVIRNGSYKDDKNQKIRRWYIKPIRLSSPLHAICNFNQ